MRKIKDRINDEVFIEVCNTSSTMAEASRKLGINYNSFIKRAKELNCYYPNQSGKGASKKSSFKYELNDILTENSSYGTSKLKDRLLKCKLKQNKCEECGISEWNNNPISLHLHHIDGNNSNNLIENLKILCPNCHSQTDNYCSKNKKNKIIESITDINIITPVKKYKKISNKCELSKRELSKCKTCDKDTKNNKFCSIECYHKYINTNIPDADTLIKDIHQFKSCAKISKKYNVSDKTIKQWIIKYKLTELYKSYQYNIKK